MTMGEFLDGRTIKSNGKDTPEYIIENRDRGALRLHFGNNVRTYNIGIVVTHIQRHDKELYRELMLEFPQNFI